MTCILSAIAIIIAVIIAAYAAAYWMTRVIINIHGREK
jgi:hypothetical protein